MVIITKGIFQCQLFFKDHKTGQQTSDKTILQRLAKKIKPKENYSKAYDNSLYSSFQDDITIGANNKTPDGAKSKNISDFQIDSSDDVNAKKKRTIKSKPKPSRRPTGDSGIKGLNNSRTRIFRKEKEEAKRIVRSEIDDVDANLLLPQKKPSNKRGRGSNLKKSKDEKHLSSFENLEETEGSKEKAGFIKKLVDSFLLVFKKNNSTTSVIENRQRSIANIYEDTATSHPTSEIEESEIEEHLYEEIDIAINPLTLNIEGNEYEDMRGANVCKKSYRSGLQNREFTIPEKEIAQRRISKEDTKVCKNDEKALPESKLRSSYKNVVAELEQKQINIDGKKIDPNNADKNLARDADRGLSKKLTASSHKSIEGEKTANNSDLRLSHKALMADLKSSIDASQKHKQSPNSVRSIIRQSQRRNNESMSNADRETFRRDSQDHSRHSTR